MVTSATMAIRIDESLGLRNKLTRTMFCSVVAGKKLDIFFPPENPAMIPEEAKR